MHPTEPLEGIVITGDDAGPLVSVSGRSPLDLFTTPGVVPALLDAIRQEATRDFTADLSTDRGRKEIASRAFKVAKSKTYLDDLGKEEVARLKDLPRQVDAGRKALRDGLDALRDEIRQPLTAWEEKQEALKARLSKIQNAPATLMNATALAIREGIAFVDAMPTDAGTWEELAGEAEAVRRVTLLTLEEMAEKAEKREKEAAELEALRAEKAERERKEREEQLRREGEERARAQAAAQASASAPQPEPQAPAAQTGTDPQAQPPAAAPLPPAQADALRRGQDPAADLEHRRAFNREALADLEAALGPVEGAATVTDAAKAVLTAIVTGKIRHVSITY